MLKILLIVALLATLGVLAFGVFALFKGGEFNEKWGNRAMRWRIIMQAIALLIFALMLVMGP